MDWIMLGHWAIFYVGYIANVIRQAQTSISSSSNSVQGMDGWLKLHWHVIFVRMIAATIFAPLMLKIIPDSMNFPVWSVFGATGFVADNLVDSLLFIFGQKIGMKVELPQIAPPPKLEDKKE